jgi:hypothetical protein
VKQVIAAIVASVLYQLPAATSGETPPSLRIGRAGHAFDHLGGFSDQAGVAAASGATIIYATGLGSLGYAGLPPANEFEAHCRAVTKYNRDAKAGGIELSLGYLCATSIVKLDAFDKNWSAGLRARIKSQPAEWRQKDEHGQPLASWYGGDYNAACMNHPDWRTYQEFMVQQQLETGHDGIFFDNPTVHPQGCYCPHCMERFAAYLEPEASASRPKPDDRLDRTAALRQLAAAHPSEFLRFRSTIARDFLQHIRNFARSINPNVLITCNNSLNSPDHLYRQSRVHGYNIWELSKVEDLVVVEDMLSQPRRTADSRVFEYGPMYKQLHAISHGKPVVAVTIADGDYHTPPNLVRLAMAEAAANGASYLSWPTWPENQRQRMIAAIRPQADLLRKNENLLNDAEFRADVVLFLPFQRWVETDACRASALAAALSQSNIQYRAIDERNLDLPRIQTQSGLLLVESLDLFTPIERKMIDGYQRQDGFVVAADRSDWLTTLRSRLTKPSLVVDGPSTVRAVVRDQPGRTIVHLYNLKIERISSFEDKVSPAENIKLSVRVPSTEVLAVTSHTIDVHGSAGMLNFMTEKDGDESVVEIRVPRLDISAIVVIDH